MVIDLRYYYSTGAETFAITDTEFYVPVVTVNLR